MQLIAKLHGRFFFHVLLQIGSMPAGMQILV